MKSRPVLLLSLTRDQSEAIVLVLNGSDEKVPARRLDQLKRRQLIAPVGLGDRLAVTDLGMAALAAYKAAERRELLTMME